MDRTPRLWTGSFAYGSEQSLVNPQFRQMILQLRSYMQFPQISQSSPSSRLGGWGALGTVRRLVMFHHLPLQIEGGTGGPPMMRALRNFSPVGTVGPCRSSGSNATSWNPKTD